MFEMIFKTAAKVTLHEAAPYARERAQYLQFYADQGYKPHTVHIRANELLRIASHLKQAYANLHLTKSQIKLALQERSARTAVRKCASGRQRSARLGVRLACAWLRFLGCLQRPRIPFSARLDAYCEWAREERGLSEETIAVTYGYVKGFLCWFGSHRRSISSVRISDIDGYLAHGGKAQGWSRQFVYNVAKGLKAFFYFGGKQGWASARLAARIRGPRLYAFERLPQCPSWSDVQRILRRLDPKQPNDARDRAILMLLAFYGLRSSEVAKLRLEDVDWEHDLLCVSRAKRHPRQTYPLLPSVGNAILQYLRFVRPLSNERALFLTLTFPHRGLSRGSIYQLVAKQFAALRISIPHRGPHCLRHACATHLLAQGLSMKEIGDHLGHRSSLATRVYAKVDIPGLRRVAAFDMGALP